jgi:hypothetical protein
MEERNGDVYRTFCRTDGPFCGAASAQRYWAIQRRLIKFNNLKNPDPDLEVEVPDSGPELNINRIKQVMKNVLYNLQADAITRCDSKS